MTASVNVIGAGLAGSEAAWQIANQGVKVRLYEMRPQKLTPAHHTENFAELVCTNSLRANRLTNAAGLLKEEMRTFNSIIMESADKHSVPAGGALAVDRETFSKEVTEKLHNHPNVEIINEEIDEIPEGLTVIATGPLTSDALAKDITKFTGSDGLFFFDAELHDFEDDKFFEGCMPIEEIASRGAQTMLYGPLKPVGLEDPRTGKEPFAVVQLRQDNAAGDLYNIVGFQTHLKWGEQKRVFSMIPGLENARFVRYGVMHRNTFLCSPEVMQATYQTKKRPDLFFAGQMTGVEGYVESAASGLYAGLNAARIAQGKDPVIFPEETMMGAMAHYITHASVKNFQPINANFGIVPKLQERIRNKQERNLKISERAIDRIKKFKNLNFD
ncbi:methylenetetrahydrofolate--tRNA-(uracil(54)-C(5))-methyltransferase (FADH(2)-oxidizing) TrmFO [Lactobacillus salivarius]|uniref:methylenetetrahydrofolate--tRNA-(uracil(54)- C(5))-methyltransferase (FADH(2)-oxidizing) TrmFO n=1 Tax=Ligilactobacillus salivarius TaxID=1624 RepID=UPI001369B835|nr:methylenetetrahydrofolate--tRNA-(uracil(54)-C(5))-methyltransferase (FADH(2)-oxidizing) TrmFO [Ligilactobacillus salivarius]MYU94232.1 methylenetetrahydrofolate--tRNA-(uracil(54)-C(5))-methyltransferase (FADH(2)-oxidizing) TrmFO [Ligilactobacillus salivarius]